MQCHCRMVLTCVEILYISALNMLFCSCELNRALLRKSFVSLVKGCKTLLIVVVVTFIVITFNFQVTTKLNVSRISTASLGNFTEKLVRNSFKLLKKQQHDPFSVNIAKQIVQRVKITPTRS